MSLKNALKADKNRSKRLKIFSVIKRKIITVVFLESLIDAFFSFCLLLMSRYFIDLNYIPMLIVCMAVFLVSFLIRKKKISLYIVEKKYPHLREILRTCADNIKGDNEVINQLYRDLNRRIKFVSNFSFLNRKELLVKVLIICAVSFLIVFIASYEHVILDYQQDFTQKYINNKNSSINRAATASEIKESSYNESGKEINILSSGSEFSFGEVNEAVDKNFSEGTSSGARAVSENPYYSSDYSGSEEDTIKDYFNKISGE